jgi:hypothetical protein
MTLKINTTDGLLHLYRSGTTTDVVTPQNPANITSVNITGRNNVSDILTVDYSNGNPIPFGGLNFNGGIAGTSGSNSLYIVGSSADENATLSATQITGLSVGAITYSNTTYFSFQLGGGNNNLTIDNATLKIDQNNAISTGTNVTINNGVLDLNGKTDTVKDLVLHSGSILNGVLHANSYLVESGTVTAAISGTGDFTKSTNSIAAVSNINTTNVTVSGGQLTVSSLVANTLTIGPSCKITISPISANNQEVQTAQSSMPASAANSNAMISQFALAQTAVDDIVPSSTLASPIIVETDSVPSIVDIEKPNVEPAQIVVSPAIVSEPILAATLTTSAVNADSTGILANTTFISTIDNRVSRGLTLLPTNSRQKFLGYDHGIIEAQLNVGHFEKLQNNIKTTIPTLLNEDTPSRSLKIEKQTAASNKFELRSHIAALQAIVANLYESDADVQLEDSIFSHIHTKNHARQLAKALDSFLHEEDDLIL